MTRRMARLATWVAVVAVIAAGAVYWRAERAEVPPALVTGEVTRGALVDSVEATGTVQAVTTVQVGTQVSGTIRTLRADFNSEVRRGQVIAELDPSLFQTQVEQAQAGVARLLADVERARVQVEDSRIKLARAQQLSNQQLISASDLETAQAAAREAAAALQSAEAQVTQARASLNQAAVNLEHTIIRAPIDGVVVSRNVDVGQTVAASMQAPTLFIIAKDLTEMQVNANVDEADIGRIRTGQAVTFRVDAYRDETFTGEVQQVRLNPITEQNVVSYVTVIRVPNPELKLKPGMTANVSLEVARADDVVQVPTGALRFRPGADLLAAYNGVAPELATSPAAPARAPGNGPAQDVRPARGAAAGTAAAESPHGAMVWVLSDGHLRSVPVITGLSTGTLTAVEGDVEAGDIVVLGGGAAKAGTGGGATGGASGSPLLPRFPGRGGQQPRQGVAGGGRS